ncbi:hypothetical protein KO361_01775 [Candidatus Woesearchaeota archaeon]|nr:hypothetical protein [Candidatus Woesearchaeota archaeon]
MTIQIILIIIGLALVFLLSFRLLKGVIKALISVVIISIVLIGVLGIVIYTDAMALKKGFEGEKTIIITEEQLLITAFKITSDVTLSSAINQKFYESITPQEIDELFEKIKEEDYEEIEENGILIVIEQKTFYDDEITLSGRKIKMEEQTLKDFALATSSNEATTILENAEVITQQEAIILREEGLHEIKNKIYYALLATKMKETKGNFLIKEVKNQNINIKPEMLSIKMLNFFPKKIMNNLMNVTE